GSKTSLNNFVYHEIDENVTPVAQSISVIPNSGRVNYGGTVYLRANISDNNALGLCDWAVYGTAIFNPSDSTQCRASFAPTTEGVYYVDAIPVDYYSNRGDTITREYNVNIVPVSLTTTIDRDSPYYNGSAGDSVTINATFNIVGSDSLGTCEIIAENDTNEFSLGSFAASGNICYGSAAISSLSDGSYRVFARVIESTDGDIIESSSRALLVCSSMENGVCKFADYNLDGLSDICPAESDAPIVELISPLDGATASTTAVFEFNATDQSTIDNCSLIINNELVETRTSIVRNATESFTRALNAGMQDFMNGA
ncbi:MAG: hypothetical protein MUF61_03625, partial [archaeon]|nr:hypothetical protein [archaeon]